MSKSINSTQGCFIYASPNTLFSYLSEVDNWSQWIGYIESVEWQSDSVACIDAVRKVFFKDKSYLVERFDIWEENKKFSFFVESTSIPNLRDFRETYTLKIMSKNQIFLKWELKVTVSGWKRIFIHLAKPLINQYMKTCLLKLRTNVEVL